jgi:hypothetical protein
VLTRACRARGIAATEGSPPLSYAGQAIATKLCEMLVRRALPGNSLLHDRLTKELLRQADIKLLRDNQLALANVSHQVRRRHSNVGSHHTCCVRRDTAPRYSRHQGPRLLQRPPTRHHS